jgi:isochorismate hydrolase
MLSPIIRVFRYKKSLTQMKSRKFGLIAEEVEKVDSDLVAHDDDGTLTTVRYEAMNAMLLNEFLKEHRKVQTLEGMIAQQQLQIETLTAAVQKVAIPLNW